jgi:DNA-binding NarL/FixJ family response regulator
MTPKSRPAATESVPRAASQRRIFLVDDHAVFRDGLGSLLVRSADLEVCGGATLGQEALLRISDMTGLELLKHLKTSHPQLPVLVLSMHDEAYYAQRCLRAGARGYIMKKEPIGQVEIAVRQILDGKVYLSQAMSDEFLLAVARGDAAKVGSPVNLLSDRELEVFECIGRGLGASEVARKLRLSVKTIESYQAKLKEKLHLKDSSALFQHALHWVERR